MIFCHKTYSYHFFVSVIVLALTTALSSAEDLKGDASCKWGAADCNACVNNVEAALTGLETNYKSAQRIRFDGYAYPNPKEDYLLHSLKKEGGPPYYQHIQSIGRLAGVGNSEYMVFTTSTASDTSGTRGAVAITRMGAAQNTQGNVFPAMPDGDGSDQNTHNRTIAATYPDNNHPGGVSVLGKYVYVAQWCQDHGNYDWCSSGGLGHDRSLGFSVYDISNVDQNASINSHPPVELYYKDVSAEDWIKGKSTSSIGVVKLSNGNYLAALGKSSNQNFGFYDASSPIGPFTLRNSIKVAKKGEKEKEGENANIVTECVTGNLYLFQIGETADVKGTSKVYLFKLVQNSNSEIDLQSVTDRTFTCRGDDKDGTGDWCNFNAGAGVYVTPSNGLVLYATWYYQTDDGNIRVVQFAPEAK